MKQIQLQKVSKRFGDVEVIPPLDLEIETGEFVVFVGPSGCGKSTLLRLVAGLEDVSEGQILINGKDATAIPPAERGLAMVFQSYALYPHMSVRNNIAFPLRMAGIDKAKQTRRVEEAAKTLNLTEYLDRRPGQLSGGQRQRVAIARALINNPRCVLMDEPTGNLDPESAAQILTLMESLEWGQTGFVVVTHDRQVANQMARQLTLIDGRLVGDHDAVA